MQIFYGQAAGRPNVPASSPSDEPLEVVLQIYKNLERGKGFLGINIGETITVQLSPSRRGDVYVELLAPSTASYDEAKASAEFGETLIRAVAEGKDVAALARSTLSGWEHVELKPSSKPPETAAPLLPELRNENVEFTATEAGFKDGLGGASNSKSEAKQHYVLFGIQEDPQHQWNSGIYFEFDNQRNGRVNSVQKVSIGDKVVSFLLKNGATIIIKCDVNEEQWAKFREGIYTVFPDVQPTNR